MGLIEARLLPLLVEYLRIELKQINLSNLLVESFFFISSRTPVKKIICFESHYLQKKNPYQANSCTCSLN